MHPERKRIVPGRHWLAALLLLAGPLAACGGGEGEAAQRGGGRGGPGGFGGPTVVETARAETGSIAREVSVSGVVEPLRSVGVNSQVAGALLAVNVEEGDHVRAGQVLARLDGREVAAQVASAEAAFEVARSTYERAEQLRQGEVITVAELERDRAAFLAAEAQLNGLRTRLGYTTIRAPSSGVVTAKEVEAGDVVGAQTRLFTVGDLSTPVVRVGVSELDVVSLREGEEVQVALDAYPAQTFQGRIRRIFPAADPETRLVPVEVALGEAAARAARPGFLARATFALGAKEGVLLVPASAITGGAGAQTVFVVKGGTVERRSVETGLTSRGRIEIMSGLQPGETVVTLGNNELRDGAEVRVVAGPGAGEAPARRAAAGAGNAGGER